MVQLIHVIISVVPFQLHTIAIYFIFFYFPFDALSVGRSVGRIQCAIRTLCML